MKISVIFILSIVLFAECVSVKQRKQELTNLCSQISRNKPIPDSMRVEFAEYIKQIQKRRNSDVALFGVLGALVGVLTLPVSAPLFAAAGLSGAAAYSSGFAAIGGGSLAAGGFGMLGGTVVAAASGAVIGSLTSYKKCNVEFRDFMRTQYKKIWDKITVGDYIVQATFEYKHDEMFINGPASIYKNGAKVFDGKIYCENDCSLLGDFY